MAQSNTAVAQKVNTVRGLLDRQKNEIAAALPKHMSIDKFVRVFMTEVRKTPKLLDCTQESLCKCMIQSAQLGLYPDGVTGHAYLIPYGREATLIPGYKGLLHLVRQSGEIDEIMIETVFDGDTFTYTLGDDPKLVHEPSLESDRVDPKDITHVYCIVRLKDGGRQRAIWPRKKIDAHAKQYSKSVNQKDGPWKTAWESMAKKTVLRSLCNGGLLPISTEVMRMVELEMKAEVEYYRDQLRHTQSPRSGSGMEAITHSLTSTETEETIDGEYTVNEKPSESPETPSKKKAAQEAGPEQKTRDEPPESDGVEPPDANDTVEQARGLFGGEPEYVKDGDW